MRWGTGTADGEVGALALDGWERAARARLAVLFQAVDRLTPDELARIGCRLAPPEERDTLLDAVDAAAARTGRSRLVGEARDAAREAVLTRYSVGSFHPTFLALNWGISQGTVESRVAIAETLADAAAAAVVEDVLDPEVAEALALDAASITGLATGDVSEGALARVLRDPEDADLRPSRGARLARGVVAAAMVALAAFVWTGPAGAAVVAIVVAVVVAVRALIRVSGGAR